MKLKSNRAESRRGSALVIATIATLVLSGMAVAMLTVGGASKKEHAMATDHINALYVAEAGLSRGIEAATRGATPSLGSSASPIPFAEGSYWGTFVTNDTTTRTLTVYGTSRAETRALEAVVVRTSEGLYASSVFAGNSSGDPTYSLTFGGTGAQADSVGGNIYSGGNIQWNGTATLGGLARASGTITGISGTTNVMQPIPDLAGMNYATTSNVDVAANFASATFGSGGSYGGNAWQLPESDSAHIFRKNPSDRTSNTAATVKDDYFLEDLYEPLNSSSTTDRSAGSHITIAGVGGEPGSNANDYVYYIDGNLWIHNNNVYSFTLWNAADTPIKVTIVVKGNIYVSDNIFYDNPNSDGLALIAMKDASVVDSGNVYFGDPSFGTLEYMEAFMYAENNFLDNNLSASGSARVTVRGNMTAGNQVRINRDVGSVDSKLSVVYDERVWDQSLTLPGLPTADGTEDTYEVKSWREVGLP